jgi:hypothetical protein
MTDTKVIFAHTVEEVTLVLQYQDPLGEWTTLRTFRVQPWQTEDECLRSVKGTRWEARQASPDTQFRIVRESKTTIEKFEETE